MSSGSSFVVAAYAVILFVLVMYLVIAGARSARIAREAELLARLVDDVDGTDPSAAEPRDASFESADA